MCVPDLTVTDGGAMYAKNDRAALDQLGLLAFS